jgi:hypothetical protein
VNATVPDPPRLQRGRPRRCPDEVLALVVRMRAGGALLTDICDHMNAACIPTPGNGAHWWPSHVHRLLRTRDGEKALAEALASNEIHDDSGHFRQRPYA